MCEYQKMTLKFCFLKFISQRHQSVSSVNVWNVFAQCQEQWMAWSSCPVNVWICTWVSFILVERNKLTRNLWAALDLGPAETEADHLPLPPGTQASFRFLLQATGWKLPMLVPCPSTCRAQGTALLIGSRLVWFCKTHWGLLPLGFMTLIVL